MSTRSIRIQNVGRETFWYVVIALSVFIVSYQVQANYERRVDPQSLTDFIVNVCFNGIVLGLLAFFWWRMANAERMLSDLRIVMEYHSFPFSLLLLVTAFLLTLPFYLRCHVIMGISGYTYSLDCIFILPVVFSALNYILPPIQIREVIVPGGRIWSVVFRFLTAAGFLAFAFYLVKVNHLV